jgi:hypothetical protein
MVRTVSVLIALAAKHDAHVHDRDHRQYGDNRDQNWLVDHCEGDRAGRANHDAEGRQDQPQPERASRWRSTTDAGCRVVVVERAAGATNP